jgi:hypothetical protein
MAALLAIAACAAHAQPPEQVRPAQVLLYRPVFYQCRKAGGAPELAIRRMEIDGQSKILIVDPATLATRLEPLRDWTCADTNDDQQKDTRYIRAVQSSTAPQAGPAAPSPVIANGGLLHGTPSGSFITGDLCPSRRPLDRAFLQDLLATRSPLPVALSISGTWLARHKTDFAWLRAQERAGALNITWVDHSYDHPYVPGRPFEQNFLLSPGVDMQSEILQTERILIAHGETPSVFFRFPGLISNAALMHMTEDDHLIVLGAGAWLARSPRARPGDIVLVHLNGNEPVGLRIFSALLAGGKLPEPFRPIDDAP